MRWMLWYTTFSTSTISLVFGQDSAQVAWIRFYEGPERASLLNALTTDRLGNVYVAGGTYESERLWDMVTIKYTTDGEEDWIARYNRTGNYSEGGEAIAIDDTGNVYVAGSSGIAGGPYSDFTLVKYDPNGLEIWSAHYNGPSDFIDNATGIVRGRDGGIYITGSSEGGITTLKYSPGGEMVWIAHHDDGFPTAITADDDLNIYVVAYAYSALISENVDYLTVKYDSMGIEQWSVRYDGAPGAPYLSDIPLDVDVDNAGHVLVTGSSESVKIGSECATIQYTASGDLRWIRRGGTVGRRIIITPSGQVFVGGDTFGENGLADYAIVKYTNDGDTTWLGTYNGPANGADFLDHISLDELGNIYATGTSQGMETSFDFATVKFDPEANLRWAARYTGPGIGYDVATGLGLGYAGEVFVGGYAEDNGHSFVTIKYVDTGIVSVPDETKVPVFYSLSQNYPNPFNGISNFEFRISKLSLVSLRVYDLLGQEVATIVSEELPPGSYTRQWDANRFAGGVYFCQLKAGGFIATKSMMLIR